jgi:hypothetical protein
MDDIPDSWLSLRLSRCSLLSNQMPLDLHEVSLVQGMSALSPTNGSQMQKTMETGKQEKGK